MLPKKPTIVAIKEHQKNSRRQHRFGPIKEHIITTFHVAPHSTPTYQLQRAIQRTKFPRAHRTPLNSIRAARGGPHSCADYRTNNAGRFVLTAGRIATGAVAHNKSEAHTESQSETPPTELFAIVQPPRHSLTVCLLVLLWRPQRVLCYVMRPAEYVCIYESVRYVVCCGGKHM